MIWRPIDDADSHVMAEAIGETAFSYLGGFDVLESLEVRYFANEARAEIWANLAEPTFAAQLLAVEAFSEVRDCYIDELALELRFGSPLEQEVRELVASRTFARPAI